MITAMLGYLAIIVTLINQFIFVISLLLFWLL